MNAEIPNYFIGFFQLKTKIKSGLTYINPSVQSIKVDISESSYN